MFFMFLYFSLKYLIHLEYFMMCIIISELPRWCRIYLPMKETQVQTLGWVGKIPWRRKWHPTPVFFLGKSMNCSMPGCSVHGLAKSQPQLSTHTYTRRYLSNFIFLFDYHVLLLGIKKIHLLETSTPGKMKQIYFSLFPLQGTSRNLGHFI